MWCSAPAAHRPARAARRDATTPAAPPITPPITSATQRVTARRCSGCRTSWACYGATWRPRRHLAASSRRPRGGRSTSSPGGWASVRTAPRWRRAPLRLRSCLKRLIWIKAKTAVLFYKTYSAGGEQNLVHGGLYVRGCASRTKKESKAVHSVTRSRGHDAGGIRAVRVSSQGPRPAMRLLCTALRV
eukprot:scaffold12055_cov63-Phaeocystis_antarctica.AAC.3